VAYKPEHAAQLAALCAPAGFVELGEVSGNALVVRSGGRALLDVPVARLKTAWSRAIPQLVGEEVHNVALEGHAGAP
jgi:hypothetical protein